MTWVIVLVKDFDTAKQRLSPALAPGVRRELAIANAERAIAAAAGAGRVLVLSSDLPLVSAAALRSVLAAGEGRARTVVAAAASGRGGTNALFLKPPDVVGLHFGDRSLAKFEADARSRGVWFEVLDHPELALDLDEPADL